MKRIEMLREKALNEPWPVPYEFYCGFYKSYAANDHLPEFERYRKAYADTFANLPVCITPGELIVGKFPFTSDQTAAEWEQKYEAIANTRTFYSGQGQNSHMAIDYDLLMQKGISGILVDIDNYLKTADEKQTAFYFNCKACLETVIAFSNRYADAALELSKHVTDQETKAELENVSAICRRVPLYPPQSFHEAVQSTHFMTLCMSLNPLSVCAQQFQLGHPDRYLYPFYQKDIQNGVITKERAQLLLDLLGIMINLRVPSGLSSGYMLGGRDENGNIVANDLTEMGMQVIDDIRLVYPSVGLCYDEDMPEHYLRKACEILSHGRSHPAIFGDTTIQKGLMRYGVTAKQACNYIHSTCVEITPVAASNVWVASPYTNMPSLLLAAMDREYPDFEALVASVKDILNASIRKNFDEHEQMRKNRYADSYNPLLSCFVNDCLASGLDIEQGGAIYNWVMPSFVGMGNLVDSLYAIKVLVFDQHELTIAAYKKLIEQDYEGNEPLRQRILNTLPKYGNDNDEVDAIYNDFTSHIANECRKYQGFLPNANLIPSVFCWVMHEAFGRETIATPDGRKAYFPLGDGSGPCQGREMCGPTASVISSTKWDHSDFIGGVAVNMKFSKSALGPQSLDTIMALIKTYIARGGFEMQLNILDTETLKQAQKDPESFKDLVVRIGGYSDYFVRISEQMQNELIMRTEHSV